MIDKPSFHIFLLTPLRRSNSSYMLVENSSSCDTASKAIASLDEDRELEASDLSQKLDYYQRLKDILCIADGPAFAE
jgi:hypothetical protein